MVFRYINRDLSWLSFNGRVLEEAAREHVPLLERIKFLSIFSSNLDEFYRVRMPALLLLHQARPSAIEHYHQLLEEARKTISEQQVLFGRIFTRRLVPALLDNGICLVYNSPIPAFLEPGLETYFRSEVMAFLQLVSLSGKGNDFFPQSNALYKVVITGDTASSARFFLLSIPSASIPRFFSVKANNLVYILFLDDIIKHFLHLLFPGNIIRGAFNIKITRDAELDLADEFEGDLAEKIERQLHKRDAGPATRFLYEPGMTPVQLKQLLHLLDLPLSSAIEGGHYHNLKDLGSMPVTREALCYPPQPPAQSLFAEHGSIFDAILQKDCLLHTPYQSYQTVLRFFNEAAVDPAVEEIFVTLYRVAGDSRIANALITAANNGKKVTVFIELKARFDEQNNIRWSKQMKAAGVKLINSIPGLKVHAKVALVKKRHGARMQYFGLLATGNLNELTAKFYTDHILLTAHPGIVRELEMLFIFLQFRRKPHSRTEIQFQHLLVAQFNLQDVFLQLIDQEMINYRHGKPAGIIIKLNNLEDQVLINKLYEASAAGVRVQILVRSICCLEPGVHGMSEHITAARIVDRYLEHGRVFIFANAGDEKIWLGSADWMNRNIYRRVEVCFPLYDPLLKAELRAIIDLQLKDNTQASGVTGDTLIEILPGHHAPVRSQSAIYSFLQQKQPYEPAT